MTALGRRSSELGERGDEDRGVRLDPPVRLRAHHRVDLEAVVGDELVEVALTVRDEPDLDPVTSQLVEHRKRVLVEREVLVALPLPHHVHRARSGASRVASHPEHDLLRERDPDLLVVNEITLARQRLDRIDPCLRVALRVEDETVAFANSPVPLRPELRSRSKEREVDVEEDGPEHRSSIALTFFSSRYPFRARGVAQPGSALRSGRRGPQFKSGHPDLIAQ